MESSFNNPRSIILRNTRHLEQRHRNKFPISMSELMKRNIITVTFTNSVRLSASFYEIEMSYSRQDNKLLPSRLSTANVARYWEAYEEAWNRKGCSEGFNYLAKYVIKVELMKSKQIIWLEWNFLHKFVKQEMIVFKLSECSEYFNTWTEETRSKKPPLTAFQGLGKLLVLN